MKVLGEQEENRGDQKHLKSVDAECPQKHFPLFQYLEHPLRKTTQGTENLALQVCLSTVHFQRQAFIMNSAPICPTAFPASEAPGSSPLGSEELKDFLATAEADPTIHRTTGTMKSRDSNF